MPNSEVEAAGAVIHEAETETGNDAESILEVDAGVPPQF